MSVITRLILQVHPKHMIKKCMTIRSQSGCVNKEEMIDVNIYFKVLNSIPVICGKQKVSQRRQWHIHQKCLFLDPVHQELPENLEWLSEELMPSLCTQQEMYLQKTEILLAVKLHNVNSPRANC